LAAEDNLSKEIRDYLIDNETPSGTDVETSSLE